MAFSLGLPGCTQDISCLSCVLACWRVNTIGLNERVEKRDVRAAFTQQSAWIRAVTINQSCSKPGFSGGTNTLCLELLHFFPLSFSPSPSLSLCVYLSLPLCLPLSPSPSPSLSLSLLPCLPLSLTSTTLGLIS